MPFIIFVLTGIRLNFAFMKNFHGTISRSTNEFVMGFLTSKNLKRFTTANFKTGSFPASSSPPSFGKTHYATRHGFFFSLSSLLGLRFSFVQSSRPFKHNSSMHPFL